MAAPRHHAQKKTLRASEQTRPDVALERAAFRELMLQWVAEDLVFVDACGVNRAMTPRYGRSRQGARCFGEAPRNYGKNVTLIGALTVEGLSVCLQVEGATTTSLFVEELLVPVLRPGQIVLLDNRSAHKCTAVEVLIAEAGARVVWLPRYSPEYNAIEGAWSKRKGLLRKWERLQRRPSTRQSAGRSA